MEQALVFASIILGVGLAIELQNFNRLLRSSKVRWHWAQAMFAILVLFTTMSFWWMIAGSDRQEISLGQFLPVMWALIILNLLAAASLPDEIPEDGLDMAAYYQNNRRYLWTLYLLFVLPLSANWLVVLYLRTGSVWQTLQFGVLEIVPVAACTMLIFVRKWWLVAFGYALLSILVVAWLSRAI